MTEKKLLIGIDGNEANVVSRVGSNVYAFELLAALYAELQRDPRFSVRIYLSSPPVSDWPAATSWWRYRVLTPAKLWTQWRLPLDLYLHNDLDLFFSPGHYLPRYSPVPTVASIMDVAFEFYPQQFRRKDLLQLKTLTARSARQAQHLIAISEHTKADVVKVYGRDPKDVTVIYPAVKSVKRVSTAIVEKTLAEWNLQEPYILFLGTLQPRKNIVRLIEAWEKVRAGDGRVHLVLGGKIGWLGEPIQARIDASEWKKDIIQTGFVSEEEKQALIQGASATALVGLYEGFGIPPLESIQLGTVPVVSSTSSLPEVVGPEGLTVNPESVDDIARGLNEALQLSPEKRTRLLETLQHYVKRFSWQKSGQQLLETLERVARAQT